MKLLVLSFVAGCYLRQLPITPVVVHASSSHIAVQLRDESERRGLAWAIDEHHLLTAGALCGGAENVALLVDGGVVPTVVRAATSRLCLLDVPAHVHLGRPLLIARGTHHQADHLAIVGSPRWVPLGVVGLVLELGPDGAARDTASRAEILAFARSHGVTPAIAPPQSDVDFDLSCADAAKARGWCDEFEPSMANYGQEPAR